MCYGEYNGFYDQVFHHYSEVQKSVHCTSIIFCLLLRYTFVVTGILFFCTPDCNVSVSAYYTGQTGVYILPQK